ncbi:glutathione S-transferase [Neisseria sp. HSC-16F19]|nr:DUF2789 family protein [Neisseria sp. HSC-16F19]MCP2041559.1 glutathione S-transferase [Neisseria sp. HSC-16F19]
MPAHQPEFIERCAGFTDLFEQLGLPSQPEQIADFISTHRPLSGDVLLADAPFWSSGQSQFIREQKQLDEPPWTLLIDQLSEALRNDTQPVPPNGSYMKLYYAPGTCALACWIALEWAGAEYEAVKADYASEEYRRINPLAAVPALDIGKERAMTQAPAILQYIADQYPQADIGSNPGLENAFELNETLAFLASDFHPAFWPFFMPYRYTTDESEAAKTAVKEAAYARVDRAMQHLDKLIANGKGHVYQGKRSIADAYAYVMARWTTYLPKTWQAYPHVAAFMQRMEQDEAVQRVLAAQKD